MKPEKKARTVSFLFIDLLLLLLFLKLDFQGAQLVSASRGDLTRHFTAVVQRETVSTQGDGEGIASTPIFSFFFFLFFFFCCEQ